MRLPVVIVYAMCTISSLSIVSLCNYQPICFILSMIDLNSGLLISCSPLVHLFSLSILALAQPFVGPTDEYRQSSLYFSLCLEEPLFLFFRNTWVTTAIKQFLALLSIDVNTLKRKGAIQVCPRQPSQ